MRELPVASGTLLVRPVEASDIDGLSRLYDNLSTDDRYRRFFCGFRPDAEFLAREVRAVDVGGFELVAEHRARDAGDTDGEIVAAASWSPLPDGDGELAITVARHWRGWLGPYLLDALLDAAGDRDIPNLQANVLLMNRAMLALVRARGFVTMGHPDVGVVRVVLGARARMPAWPVNDPRPRVLVEVPGGRWHAEGAANAAGLQVLTCFGPHGVGSRRCPATTGSPCPLAETADAIVVCHAPDDGDWLRLRRTHQRLHSSVPVCVERGWRPSPRIPGERLVPSGDEETVVTFVQQLVRYAGNEA